MDSVKRTVLEIYKEADAEVAAAGPVCESSGRCCRFEEYGHRLYISNLEADVLLADAPPFDLPVSDAFCPFQIDNLCTTRAPRPLGCRVYFCDPSYRETGNEITEKYLRRLRELAVAHGLEWEYAPLHTFLNKTNGAAAPLSEVKPPPARRTALPIVPV